MLRLFMIKDVKLLKKLYAFLFGLLFLFSAAAVPVQAAPKTSTGITINVTKDVDGITDNTSFSVVVYKDNVKFKEGTISESKPLVLSNLKAGTYRVEELAKSGYTNVSISGPITISVKGTYTIAVVNSKDTVTPPPVETFHYLALGDSIATGNSSRGTTTSYVTTFYNHLKTLYPYATMRNLAVDGDDASELLARLRTSTYIDEIKKADVITLSIGGNNIMDAGENFFTSLNNAIAEANTIKFESDYPKIITAIRALNIDARIIVQTLYNPFNSISIKGYTGDPALQIETETYILRVNTAITSIIDPNYTKVDIHKLFLESYAKEGLMGDITYFYPNIWLKLTRDPHPNQAGENLIGSKFIEAYLVGSFQ
jgi:lysophospholipase L1-like esterase